MLMIEASGSVSDYSVGGLYSTNALRGSIAASAGVDASLVSVTVVAASVIITATITVLAATAASVQTKLSSSLGTAAAASAALGITVESDPSIKKLPVTGGSDDDTEAVSGGSAPPIAAIGGGAAVAIMLMVLMVFLYLRKKRTACSQSSVALTAISLTTTKEKDLEGGGGALATKGPTATRKATTYSVELAMTPMGLGFSLTDDVVTEIKSDSQAAWDGNIKVGDRVLTVNGEAPTTAKPSSTILQATVAGSMVKLDFTSEPEAVSAVTEMGQSSSVSAEPSVSASQSKVRTVPVAVLARESQKMRSAAELLESWKLDPSELIHGDKVGAGGQADVYVGRWQVSPRTSAHLPTGFLRPHACPPFSPQSSVL